MADNDLSSLAAALLDGFETGSSRGQRTKIQIIEKAAEVFATSGFHGTSMRAVARACNIDHSTLLHHFKSKESLLISVLRWRDVTGGTEALEGDVLDSVTTERIADGVARLVVSNSERPELTRLFSIMTAEAGSEDHPAREYLRARQAQMVEAWSGVIEVSDESSRGESPDFNSHELAAMFVALWDGLQMYDALSPGDVDVSSILRRVSRYLFSTAPGTSTSNED